MSHQQYAVRLVRQLFCSFFKIWIDVGLKLQEVMGGSQRPLWVARANTADTDFISLYLKIIFYSLFSAHLKPDSFQTCFPAEEVSSVLKLLDRRSVETDDRALDHNSDGFRWTAWTWTRLSRLSLTCTDVMTNVQ